MILRETPQKRAWKAIPNRLVSFAGIVLRHHLPFGDWNAGRSTIRVAVLVAGSGIRALAKGLDATRFIRGERSKSLSAWPRLRDETWGRPQRIFCARRVRAGEMRSGRIGVGVAGGEASSRCAPMEEARWSRTTCGATGTRGFRPAAAFPDRRRDFPPCRCRWPRPKERDCGHRVIDPPVWHRTGVPRPALWGTRDQLDAK